MHSTFWGVTHIHPDRRQRGGHRFARPDAICCHCNPFLQPVTFSASHVHISHFLSTQFYHFHLITFHQDCLFDILYVFIFHRLSTTWDSAFGLCSLIYSLVKLITNLSTVYLNIRWVVSFFSMVLKRYYRQKS